MFFFCASTLARIWMNNRSHLNGTTKGRSRIIQCILHIIRYDYISYVRDCDNIYVLKYRFLDVSSQESPKKQRHFCGSSAKTATTIGGNAEPLWCRAGLFQVKGGVGGFKLLVELLACLKKSGWVDTKPPQNGGDCKGIRSPKFSWGLGIRVNCSVLCCFSW